MKKHGHNSRNNISPTYISWMAMRTRCSYPKHIAYPRYGGRGITVCARWNKFENFLADMGERPSGMSLDRIDSDGNYQMDNCRWATVKQQQRNTKFTRKVEYKGEIVTLAELAERFGVDLQALRSRVNRNWEIDRALSVPVAPPRGSRICQ